MLKILITTKLSTECIGIRLRNNGLSKMKLKRYLLRVKARNAGASRRAFKGSVSSKRGFF